MVLYENYVTFKLRGRKMKKKKKETPNLAHDYANYPFTK